MCYNTRIPLRTIFLVQGCLGEVFSDLEKEKVCINAEYFQKEIEFIEGTQVD
jgi:hypothetical protein